MTLWENAEVIVYIDVDEFMWPCRDSWSASVGMWEYVKQAVAAAISAGKKIKVQKQIRGT